MLRTSEVTKGSFQVIDTVLFRRRYEGPNRAICPEMHADQIYPFMIHITWCPLALILTLTQAIFFLFIPPIPS